MRLHRCCPKRCLTTRIHSDTVTDKQGGQTERASRHTHRQTDHRLTGTRIHLVRRELTQIVDFVTGGGTTLARGVDCVWAGALALAHFGPWACCALVANAWPHLGAAVLELYQRARHSTKRAARLALVELNETTRWDWSCCGPRGSSVPGWGGKLLSPWSTMSTTTLPRAP